MMTKISKCLFPVAGYGTRFLPATKTVPKEMLPILTKPLVQYAVEEAMSADIRKMSMVTNKYKSAIEDYFKPSQYIKDKNTKILLDSVNLLINECDFAYTSQKQMLGLGHAIYSGKKLVGDSAFAVILPDDLCINDGESVLMQMVKISEKYPDYCIVAIEEVPMSEVSRYGVIKGKAIPGSTSLYMVETMVEKPSQDDAPSNLAIIGRYILIPEIFNAIESTDPDINGEIQITDALMSLAEKERVIAYKFEGKRFDCGSIKGYIKANSYFAQIEGIL